MKEKIYNHTYHSYLTKQIVLPEIDDNKLILLLTILLQSNKLSQKNWKRSH